MRLPRPFARAVKRLSVVPCSTKMVLTFSSSMSAPSLCSALAMADSSTFLMITAAFFCVNVRMLRAWSTFLPRIRSATRRPLSTDRRTPRRTARVSDMFYSLLLGFFVRRVTLEGTGQREFRSEEHTSELQSQSNLVCRLLLEKKKNEYKEQRDVLCHVAHESHPERLGIYPVSSRGDGGVTL